VSQPIEAFRNALKIPELRTRIGFTLLMLAVYRLGAHVPTPGINGAALARAMEDMGGGILGLYDMFTGGAFENATIFALGIMPYISASIIMQLLVAVVPYLEKLQKEGAEGQKKINDYTRYGTIGLCLVQSTFMATFLTSLNAPGQEIVPNPGLGFHLMCILSFTTGAAFIMWLGEQISENGVGNGISLVIFVSIISAMPAALYDLGRLVRTGDIDPFTVLILAAIFVAVVAGVVLVTTGTRRVPTQSPSMHRGRRMTVGGRNFIPLRVNQAGVIPIIFASSIMMLPSMLGNAINVPFLTDFFRNYLDYGQVTYHALEALLIVFFCFFYTAITFNPVEVADNLKKYGAVVVGVRPGKATAEYLNFIMTRVTLVGATFLVAVAMLPQVVYVVFDIYSPLIVSFFGGTSLLILVGVGLDTIRQIEQHLVMRNYEGFMKGRRMRGRRM
jgi:preprotein translocase subunit SecY